MKQTTPTKTRKATEHDAHDIATIHVLAWQQAYRHILPSEVLDMLSIAARENNWRDRIAKGLDVIVIESNNQLLGFVSICPARDDDLNPQTHCEISTMYIHPKASRKGMGSKLLEAASAQMQSSGFTEAILWTARKNVDAIKFYEAMGFTFSGAEKTETLGARTRDEASDEHATRDSTITFQEIRYHKKLCQ